MYTLHLTVAGPDYDEHEGYEEYDQVSTIGATSGHTVSEVIADAYDELLRQYGDAVHVHGVVNQSTGAVIFDARLKGYVSIPVVPPALLLETSQNARGNPRHPYDAIPDLCIAYDLLLDLCRDESEGWGTADYRDWLLGKKS